jgi:hypothetical protein
MGLVGVFGTVGAAADEHKTLAVDHTQAGAGAIGQVFVFEFWHGHLVFHS